MGALKKKAVRLHGQQLKMLCMTVYERDNGCCVACGRWIPAGTKPHHEPPKKMGGGAGQDIEENMLMLCNDCHFRRHNGPDSVKVKEICRKYLGQIYELQY